MVEDHIDSPLTLKLGREELFVRRRYEVISIINDFFIAIWMFIIGSFQFLFRPTIRLISYIHVKRIPTSNWEN